MGQLRGEAALNIFREVFAREKNKSIADIFSIAARQPAPRFFVNYARAARMVAAIDNHGILPSNAYKCDMYIELHKRWRKRGGKSYKTLYDIIEQPAPSFYLSEEAFKCLVYKMMRYKNKKK